MNERGGSRARAARTIIDDYHPVHSSSHSCVLADKPNVAQLTKRRIAESEYECERVRP